MPDLQPPAAWTELPPADCPNPVRCIRCRTLFTPGRPCPWCLTPADDGPPVTITVRPEARRPSICRRCLTTHRPTDPCPTAGHAPAA